MFDRESFLALIDNDQELFKSLVELFCQDWPMVLGRLKKAINENDAEGIEKTGHRIKGNLRNFYAIELAEKALVIEEAGRSGRLSGLMDRVESLESDLKSFEVELKNFYESWSPNQ